MKSKTGKPHKRMNRGGGTKVFSATPNRPVPSRSVREESMSRAGGGADRMRGKIEKRVAAPPRPQPKPVDMDRGSRGAPMPMKTMAPKGGASMMQGLMGGRGAPVEKVGMVSPMPMNPPVKTRMPVSATKLPMATSQYQRIVGGGAATPGGREYFNRGGPMAGGVDVAATMKKGGKVQGKKMRGGGLARKGVGMALAKGGMVKANGCAKRGKTRGKIV